MRTIFINIILLINVVISFGQNQDVYLNGQIKNYSNQLVVLFECYADSLILVDSARTDINGKFKLIFHNPVEEGLLKIELKQKQSFYVITDRDIIIETIFKNDYFNNIATDSLKVIKSDVNKRFYEFQKIQKELNVASYFLLQIMRVYPNGDPFHHEVVNEYFSRYEKMEKFMENIGINTKIPLFNDNKTQNEDLDIGTKVALAYYQPVNPDWKKPDSWRDSIIASHYFEYFNPADSFYLHTNILPEKLDIFLYLSTNKRDYYGQPVNDEMLYADAAGIFLEQTKENIKNFEFCLNHILEKFDQEHKDKAFLFIYDKYSLPELGDCESEILISEEIHNHANKLKQIQVGSYAPDFELEGGMWLSTIRNDYTLILFWASWCSHCVNVLPEIREIVDNFNTTSAKADGTGMITTVAVSLDYDREEWSRYIKNNSLNSFIHYSEFNGWKNSVAGQYNVYATPTMVLLDKDKKIVLLPESPEELKSFLNEKI